MWWRVTVVPATLKGEARDLLLAQGWEGSLCDTVRACFKTERAQEVKVELEKVSSLMMLCFSQAVMTLSMEVGITFAYTVESYILRTALVSQCLVGLSLSWYSLPGLERTAGSKR